MTDEETSRRILEMIEAAARLRGRPMTIHVDRETFDLFEAARLIVTDERGRPRAAGPPYTQEQLDLMRWILENRPKAKL